MELLTEYARFIDFPRIPRAPKLIKYENREIILIKQKSLKPIKYHLM